MEQTKAKVAVLVLAATLLVATSAPAPPLGSVARADVIPAGATRASVDIEAELRADDLDGVRRPFRARVDVSSASLPSGDGDPSDGADVDVTVLVGAAGRGASPATPSTPAQRSNVEVPPAGTCDPTGCRVDYTVVFTLAEPRTSDVLVDWTLDVSGIEERTGTGGSLDVTVRGAEGVPAPPTTAVGHETDVIRFDRVGPGPVRVIAVNRGDEDVVLTLPGGGVTVPAHASARVHPFVGCSAVPCTAHAGVAGSAAALGLLTDGPVVATAIAEQPTQRPTPGATVSRLPTRRLTTTVDVTGSYDATRSGPAYVVRANDAAVLRPDRTGPTAATSVRVTMRLIDPEPGTVVRYQPRDNREPIVLSAAAGADGPRTVTVTRPGVDAQTHVTGAPELLAGRNARVAVSFEGSVAYLDGVPDGARVTADIER